MRRRRSHAAVARHKGDTPPTTRLSSTSAHSHEYNASGLVLPSRLSGFVPSDSFTFFGDGLMRRGLV